MTRIQIIDPKTATGPARELLEAVQAQLGATPNFIRVLANSPKALQGFLGLYGAAGSFALDNATRERIALAIAEGNACQYCVSAHTAIGRSAGLSNEEMLLNRKGTSADAKAAAARAAGLSEGELVEIIALVALNIFTNIVGKATRVDIDFPKVALL